MDENQKKLFADSNRIIEKLRLLSVFFEDELIVKILIRTQVIHKLFESNPELDSNKLLLFHLQFTESIIELLRKIKTNNEKAVVAIKDEIELNKELMTNLSNALRVEESFDYNKQLQEEQVGKAIFKLYQNLSDHSKENPFPKTIQQFSSKYAKDFFKEITAQLFFELLEFEIGQVYKNGYGVIDKKLLGLQCRYEFKNTFVGGLKDDDRSLELYKILNEEIYFIFYPSKNTFLSVDITKLSEVNLATPVSKKGKILQELEKKTDDLQESIPKVKIRIPKEVTKLLAEYHQKIEKIDFLDLIDDYDIQANILKAMLNTDSL